MTDLLFELTIHESWVRRKKNFLLQSTCKSINHDNDTMLFQSEPLCMPTRQYRKFKAWVSKHAVRISILLLSNNGFDISLIEISNIDMYNSIKKVSNYFGKLVYHTMQHRYVVNIYDITSLQNITEINIITFTSQYSDIITH
jgi:hypothetical protein